MDYCGLFFVTFYFVLVYTGFLDLYKKFELSHIFCVESKEYRSVSLISLQICYVFI